MAKEFSTRPQSRNGYTLPVFAAAAARAALIHLQNHSSPTAVELNLLEPPEVVTIPIEQVACLGSDRALAIARSAPGDNLDLTRDTPVWAEVTREAEPGLRLLGGEGIGIRTDGEAAIYAYARRLLEANLTPLLTDGGATVRIILPEGRRLAERTSNAAFGVVEGLSLLGTRGVAEALSAPEALEESRLRLRAIATASPLACFCLGENGLDLAARTGIDPAITLKTANWLGPLLVEAALLGMEGVLLFGYHGKLIKLAGGIFHTHHHVADGRQEVLTAIAARAGLSSPQLQGLLAQPTAEAALQQLRQWRQAETVYAEVAVAIEERSRRYIRAYGEHVPAIGAHLFDRDRQPLVTGPTAAALLARLGLASPLETTRSEVSP